FKKSPKGLVSFANAGLPEAVENLQVSYYQKERKENRKVFGSEFCQEVYETQYVSCYSYQDDD
ncbi:hypothetical protein AVEN_253633-1, partial [Araneus ventricosus]